MKMARIAIVALSVVCLATSALAGDLQSSAARVAKAQAQTQAAQAKAAGGNHGMLWAGGGLVGVGMGMVLWGLLHTSDGKYVTPIDMGKVSDPKLVGGGAAVVAAGGALMFLGTRHQPAASMQFGLHQVSVSKAISW
jgi:hypothetical protein